MVNRNTSGGAFRSDDETPANRKLIRPNLADLADRYPTRSFAQRKQAAPGLKITSRAFGFGRPFPIAQKFIP